MSNSKETLACIKKEDIKYLHSGQISKHIFPLEREEAHDQEIPHLIVRIFIISETKSQKPLYLLQQRNNTKRSYPNYFTDSASGHVEYKQNLTLKDIEENAYRELEEEFGIEKHSLEKFQFYNIQVEEDPFSIEIGYVFVGLVKNTVEIKPNPDELNIENSHFYTENELLEILKDEKSVDYSKKIWKELIDTDIYQILGDTQNSSDNIKNDTALFIGRFQPLHHGHIYVFNRIYEQYDLLKIGIGSSQASHTKENPFTREERKQFIISALKKRKISPKKYKIYYIPDIFDAKRWVSHVTSITGDFKILFSNSDWVRQLFENQGYDVANKMTIFRKKYSGTNIRKLISQNDKTWRNLVPNEVIALMKKYDGIERISSLYNKN